MRSLLSIALLASATTSPAWAAIETYVNYDGFGGTGPIDLERWVQPELSREIVGGTLLMRQRSIGNSVSNTGTLDTNHVSSLQNPNAITRLRANVKVSSVSVTGCATNPTPSEVRARVIGSFFNTGFPVSTTDRTNDVGAQIRLVHDSNAAAGELKVQGVVFRCLDADCNSSALIGTIGDLGTVSVGTYVRAQVDWDKAAKTFYMYGNGATPHTVTYTDSDASLPVFAFKQMATRTQMANCMGGPRTQGDIEVRFDNVMVNTSALP